MNSKNYDFKSTFGYDLHVHSIYSYDSISSPRAILKKARSLGLTGLAITDHDTVKGAQKLMKLNKGLNSDLHIIVGSEIKTDYGDVIGLFLEDEIKSRHIHEVIEEINEQNGFSILPHPYKTFSHVPEDILNKIDAVEIKNGRISEELNQRSWELAHAKELLCSGGSDAHLVSHIGAVSTHYNRDIGLLSIDNIHAALKEPKVIGSPVSQQSHYYTVAVGNIRKKRFKKLLSLGLKEVNNYLFR